MGNNRPVKKKDWIKFLKAHGFEKKRHKGTSHEHWKKKGVIRTIVFRSKPKEIPAMHLKTNLDSMGHDLKYLYNWLLNN